jgi:hypothetical protein
MAAKDSQGRQHSSFPPHPPQIFLTAPSIGRYSSGSGEYSLEQHGTRVSLTLHHPGKDRPESTAVDFRQWRELWRKPAGLESSKGLAQPGAPSMGRDSEEGAFELETGKVGAKEGSGRVFQAGRQ